MTAEIIVVRYGQPAIEERCLESVRRHTNLEQHALTVIDNFSRDENLSTVWNAAIERSAHPWVLLLNSDTEIQDDGWLDRLISAAQTAGACAAGPKTNSCGYPVQVGLESEGIREADQISGFCLLLKRACWEKFGGFRRDGTFYGGESILLRRLAKRIVVNDVFVRHDAHTSVKASDRFTEEKQLGAEWWRRNTTFDWTKRLAVLGGPGGEFPLWRGIDDALAEFAREGMDTAHFRADTVTAADIERFAPDLVITVNTRPSYLAHCIKALEGFRGPKGLWFSDTPRDYGFLKGAFDRLFPCFTSSAGVLGWEWASGYQTPCTYMPQASVIWPRLGPLNVRRELVFVGNTGTTKWHIGRREIVRALGAQVHNSFVRQDRLAIEKKTPDLYRQSRYVLSMSPDIPGYTSLRLYNVLAYGGLALMKRFEGCERMFTDRRHVLMWSTVEEAQKRMAEYRGQTEECERIRKRGWRLQQARHTAAARLMNMTAAMTTSDTSFWGYLH